MVLSHTPHAANSLRPPLPALATAPDPMRHFPVQRQKRPEGREEAGTAVACVEAGESRHQRAVESRPGAPPAVARSHWQAPQPRCRQRIHRPPADDAARLQTGCEEGGARTAPAAAQLRAEVEAAPATRSARGGEATQRESACGAPTAPQPQPHPHPQGHLHSPPAGGGSQPWM